MFKILEYLLYLSVGIQIFYYGILVFKYIYSRQGTKIDNNHHFPVSVIICARNECVNLQKNLPSILEQDYPIFEVLVVNDASDDDTELVLNDLVKMYSHLKVIHLTKEQKTTVGKKGALQVGISHARHDYFLLTDADCYSASSQWIRCMMQKFDLSHNLVLGVSPYENEGKFLHNIVDYETTTTLMQYVGWALWKHPYMGVGRNMAYSRQLYDKVGGFAAHLHMTSGDDDLFVQQAAHYSQVSVCVDNQSYMWSVPPQSWKEWWSQKVRHYSVGGQYKWQHQLFLGIFLLSKAYIYLSILLFVVTININMSLVCACLIYWAALHTMFLMFTHKSLLKIKSYLLIVLDMLFIGTILAQGLVSKIFKRTQWE